VPVLLRLGYGHAEGDELHPPPDGMAGLVDHGLVVGAEEDCAVGTKLEFTAVEEACSDQVAPGELLHERRVQVVVFAGLGGHGEADALQVG
jgi:hypothetical protein